MKQFVIINVEQNSVQHGGDVLIVKANEVKAAEGFEALEEMFGKKYFNFAMNECDETEVFMLPYSEELTQMLIKLAREYEDGKYWTPDMNEFMDAKLITPKGIIKVHKAKGLIRTGRRIDAMIISTLENTQTFIPPVADWQFKHRMVNGLNIVTYPATKTNVMETPGGGLSWGSGDMAFFVFPDDEENMKLLNNAIKLEPHKGQFWIPDTSEFYHNRVIMKGPFGSTEHDLYISNRLPENSILDNLQDALW